MQSWQLTQLRHSDLIKGLTALLENQADVKNKCDWTIVIVTLLIHALPLLSLVGAVGSASLS